MAIRLMTKNDTAACHVLPSGGGRREEGGREGGEREEGGREEGERREGGGRRDEAHLLSHHQLVCRGRHDRGEPCCLQDNPWLLQHCHLMYSLCCCEHSFVVATGNQAPPTQSIDSVVITTVCHCLSIKWVPVTHFISTFFWREGRQVVSREGFSKATVVGILQGNVWRGEEVRVHTCTLRRG